MDRQQMFMLNLSFLIGLLFALLILAVLTIVTWTVVKALIWRRRQQRDEQQMHARRVGPDGRPLPPASRGVCEGCGRIFEEVFHLATGQRLCAGCYNRANENQVVAGPPEPGTER